MATLIATPGSATANVYADVAFADAYIEPSHPLYGVWSVLTGDMKKEVLLEGMDEMEELNFIARRATAEQSLHFPARDNRRNEYERDGLWIVPGTGFLDQRGRTHLVTDVPVDIKKGHVEISARIAQLRAAALVNPLPGAALNSQVQTVRTDRRSVTYSSTSSSSNEGLTVDNSRLTVTAMRLLRPFLLTGPQGIL